MKQIRTALLILIFMTALLGFLYPLSMTGVARLAFREKAGGNLITSEGMIIGSRLIGQHFTSPRYFHSRPSANNYDGINSGGSNLGPSNRKLVEIAAKNIDRIRKENGLSTDTEIPSDIVLASASGLDPHISLDAALLQAGRIASARGMEIKAINELIARHIEHPYFNIFGDPYVNVVELNMALNARGVKK